MSIDGIDVTSAVRDAWLVVLGTTEFDNDDPFFEVGGDSLRLTRLRQRLNESFPNVLLSIGDLFENPTVDTMTSFVRARLAPK